MKFLSSDVLLVVEFLQRKESASGAKPGFGATVDTL
jgi:hypothetical protein